MEHDPAEHQTRHTHTHKKTRAHISFSKFDEHTLLEVKYLIFKLIYLTSVVISSSCKGRETKVRVTSSKPSELRVTYEYPVMGHDTVQQWMARRGPL